MRGHAIRSASPECFCRRSGKRRDRRQKSGQKRLVQQPFRKFIKFSNLRLEFRSSAGSFETAVDCFYFSITADEQRGGICKEIVELAMETPFDVGIVQRTTEKQHIR